jgi:osmotically-inducible protein OsmY
MQYRATAAIVTLVVLAVLGSGCRSMTGHSLGTNIDDTLTTAQVKARLSATDWHHLTWMDVDTKAGTVYLTGNVRSDTDRQRAVQLAQSTAGVRQVVNNLQVVSTPQASSAQPPATGTR